VARATPAFRPLLELVGETWHAPMLVESNPRDGDKRDGDKASPPPPPGPAGPGSAWRSSPPSEPTSDRSEARGEFEW
jgi:hypothetical protein